MYVTKGEQCFQKAGQSAIEIQTLQSKYKEADHRIIHQTYFASRQHESKCIVADDTVLILFLYMFRRCGYEIYFSKGKHSSKKGVSYHHTSLSSQYLGTSACDLLPACHALTGCHLTYQFYGRSKYRSFKIMLKKKKHQRNKQNKKKNNKLSTLLTSNVNSDSVI